jgi:hypothetical protein
MTERIQEMKKDIRNATAFSVGLYILLIVLVGNPYVFFDLGRDVSNWSGLLTIVSIPAIAIAAFFVMGDMHNWIDRTFFHEREKVNTYITDRLCTPCVSVQCLRATQKGILNEEKSSLINLFYRFIPTDDTERERSFSYFTDYYILVNLNFLSWIGFAGGIGAAVISQLTRLDELVAFLAAVVLPILLEGMRRRTKRKLLYPTEAQTQRILIQNGQELRTMLPSYRTYEDNVQCLKSGKCPL